MNRILCSTVALLALAACATAPPSSAPVSAPAAADAPPAAPWAGFSGLARIGDNRFLVVHDTKSQHDSPRLGIVEVKAEAEVSYEALAVEGWPEPWGRSNDIEGVCSLAADGEFLAVEASYWKGRPRRLLHLVLADGSVTVPAAPVLPPAGPDEESDGATYYEGIACAERADGSTLVVLGQYGGPEGAPARLRWGVYRDGEIAMDGAGDEGLAVAVPGDWRGRPRGIGDLYLVAGELWAVAAEDPGDQGPFRSVIYRVASVDPAASPPVVLAEPTTAAWTIDGFKIEALAGPAALTPGSPMSFGTEDEAYGGVWRPLPPLRGSRE